MRQNRYHMPADDRTNGGPNCAVTGAADYRGGDFGKVMSHAVLDIIDQVVAGEMILLAIVNTWPAKARHQKGRTRDGNE